MDIELPLTCECGAKTTGRVERGENSMITWPWECQSCGLLHEEVEVPDGDDFGTHEQEDN